MTKTKGLREKIEEIVMILEDDEGWVKKFGKKDYRDIFIDLFKKHFLELVGEDEKPNEAIEKIELTENHINAVHEAVEFHARNRLRKELREKVEKIK